VHVHKADPFQFHTPNNNSAHRSSSLFTTFSPSQLREGHPSPHPFCFCWSDWHPGYCPFPFLGQIPPPLSIILPDSILCPQCSFPGCSFFYSLLLLFYLGIVFLGNWLPFIRMFAGLPIAPRGHPGAIACKLIMPPSHGDLHKFPHSLHPFIHVQMARSWTQCLLFFPFSHHHFCCLLLAHLHCPIEPGLPIPLVLSLPWHSLWFRFGLIFSCLFI
jgi:hypothetical protein